MNRHQIQTLKLQGRIARASLRKMFAVKSLLGDAHDNPKVAKNSKLNVYTAPLHLAPASLSGFNVCPMATRGCIAACLHTAGNPAYMPNKTRARIARTKAYFGGPDVRNTFMVALAADIARHVERAKAEGMRCGVRLNATSDIPWESVPFNLGTVTYPNLMNAFPRVQFYDYTKRHNRRNLPRNYHLTYSLAEDNAARALEALGNGMNVAAVFAVTRGHPLPATYALADGALPTPVIDGDVHDYRPADPRGVIVGLRAKGKAIGDNSGFVKAPV